MSYVTEGNMYDYIVKVYMDNGNDPSLTPPHDHIKNENGDVLFCPPCYRDSCHDNKLHEDARNHAKRMLDMYKANPAFGIVPFLNYCKDTYKMNDMDIMFLTYYINGLTEFYTKLAAKATADSVKAEIQKMIDSIKKVNDDDVASES